MDQYQNKSLSFVLWPAIIVGFFIALPALAAPDHIVISEVQIGGVTATDEFVELFNPTSSLVNLTGWRLSKRTASGNQTNLLTVFPDINLPAQGHFLITHPTGYTNTITNDAQYSTAESLAANNTIVLFSDAGNTLVDLIGIGTASSFEGATAPNPPNGQSIERQTGSDGIIDSDNNMNDFVLTALPTPLNLTSQPSPESTPPPEEPTTSPAPNDTTTPRPPAPLSGGGSAGPLSILPGDILINEFVADPTDEDEEWIELINRTGRDIDLTGWIIEEGGERQTILSGAVAGTVPNNFFVVMKPKGNLNNAGDHIALKTQNGQIIDELSYGNWADGNLADNAPAASDPMSVARTIDGLYTGNEAIDFTATLTPTRGLSNIVTATGSTAVSGPATLRLSELLPNPTGTDTNEFIEVTNIGTAEVNIVGWRVADASGNDYTVRDNDFTNPIILPGAYISLSRTLTGIALNNTGGETVRLFPPNNSSPVHEVSYRDSAPEGASWASTTDQWSWTTTPTPGTANILTIINRPPIISIDLPTDGLTNDKLLFSAEDSTDPDGDALTFQWTFGDGESAGGETVSHAYAKAGRYRVKLVVNDEHNGKDSMERTVIIESATEPGPQVLGLSAVSGTAEIILNEIFPAPQKGEEEWIELFNTGAESMSLTGWSIQDASGRNYMMPQGLTILPNGYLVLKKSQTRLALNNTGDDVVLLNAAGEIADETSYPTAKIGRSWARDENDEWNWTNAPTPLADNIFSAEENNVETETTAAAKTKQAPGGLITISGIVTAAPGMIGERVVYLGGIKVAGVVQNLRVDLAVGQTVPDINMNDEAQVTGKIRQVQGEQRMSVADNNDVVVLNKNNQMIEPTALEATDLENNLGQLVVADGTVSKKTSGGFVMELIDGETIRVIIPPALKSKLAYPVNAEVTTIGILSHTNAGFRLLLRTEKDLVVNASAIVEEAAPADAPTPVLSSYLTVTIFGSLILAGALFYLYWQKRDKTSLVMVEGIDEEEMV
ncbi:hypothetical protein A3H10_03025 [Candidatus Uhrbacteria bacterium RIFCSPLOWO2_12_FULL_46_10]|uniref:PKD domain-containing protein n=1 Tax=Candidatus Uhrbacteria bacterium RIFCSPLOWO2_01_FULL_47_25 TaxID=1802402 RepID=A0A1F7UZ87_9BACT|nr:MAG: hypothetical protein A2752_03110 [Candidatus Uhrbacteria bacterium RIFCSPHIGHO2_01_FULL_46_23]OGL70545.1 MAG: hypothetical protein A3D60_03680 [Candidatus Uhrbacteria bacterium RIFCSPHIGHO2_02_FULL_47_29]OGL83078.1 MAG: hypothetical protein A2936_05185 [Candidatus Uhrbacteria bacterium RIFCSPLOWO2_01_FULL_47_25]OGL84167.1 MAG: hypothetical protein A3I37_03295 [Candidatus Uhrbacteria bacterium RIFCSPLOWO2_02_FULL_46_19]OGL90731.1 MAG: hypothetical protein A3H10_03025 [Candidatus Uhrbacte